MRKATTLFLALATATFALGIAPTAEAASSCTTAEAYGSCTITCRAGTVITLTAQSLYDGWVSASAECGGVGAACDGNLFCSDGSPPALTQATGACHSHTAKTVITCTVYDP